MQATQIIGVLLEGQSAKHYLMDMLDKRTSASNPVAEFENKKPLFVIAAVACAKAVLSLTDEEDRTISESAIKAAEGWLRNPSSEAQEVAKDAANRAFSPRYVNALLAMPVSKRVSFSARIAARYAAGCAGAVPIQAASWAVGGADNAFKSAPEKNYMALICQAWAEMLP